MHTLLIVESSEDLQKALTEELQKEYRILLSENGSDGLRILQEEHPDGLILNLFLQGMDGIQFLEAAANMLPKVIITLSYFYTPYIRQKVKALGDGYPILLPCRLHTIKIRLGDMFEISGHNVPMDQQKITVKHLQILNFPYGSAYEMLRVGVPLFWQDRTQPLKKELYPAIVLLCDCDNVDQVEKAIRDTKKEAWKNRDPKVWDEYFPGYTRCPRNREFINRLSECLDE